MKLFVTILAIATIMTVTSVTQAADPIPTPNFTCWTAETGPIRLTVERVDPIKTRGDSRDMPVVLENSSDQPIVVELQAATIRPCEITGDCVQKLTVLAGETARCSFRWTPDMDAYSAMYPVRVLGKFTDASGVRQTVEAIRVAETRFSTPMPGSVNFDEQPVNEVPKDGGLLLTTLKSHQVAWQYYDQPIQKMPVGWTGTDPGSRTSFTKLLGVDRSGTRAALSMHPPYRPSGGTMFVRYRLKLPELDEDNKNPIRLSFYHAIRDHHEDEPPSDGVTFRVWVKPEGPYKEGLLGTKEHGHWCYEFHTDSKSWVPGEVDLSRYAGQTITLTLESHPGPNHDTTCDSCFWGDPVVSVGEQLLVLPDSYRKVLEEVAIEIVEAGKLQGYISPPTGIIHLENGLHVGMTYGLYGLLDGAIALGDGQGHVVCYHGMNVEIDGWPVGKWPYGAQFIPHLSKGKPDAHYRVQTPKGECRLTIGFEKAGEIGLRVTIKTDSDDASIPGRITAASFGPMDRKAERVYFGHGYCIEKPKPFRVNGGGHSLSTSHVGFDFDGGLSMLMHTTTPPDSLEVDPGRNVYTLNVHPGTTFTLVPGTKGAFDCAVRYREQRLADAGGDVNQLRSSGVTKKAGRLVFDDWGGDFRPETEMLKTAFRYGVTDSMVIKHVWQRWGYDVRLPDIYPPADRWGGLEPLQEMSQVCADNGVLFGLHDNYIDFYPDADGYSYDDITFTESGEPRKAWINTGADAQSYQWRPDRFQPYLERNLKLLKKNIDQTTYFVDVFTSANVFDYYDRDGVFHSRLETQKHWGESFDTIRNTLGSNAPTVSEAGNDFLIGHLDGADCQFMMLDATPGRFRIPIDCERWSRVPWFDAVNHRTFSLHGVGYSSRYQSGRSRALHGIMSDDYISAELLTGHALMVDRNTMDHGAVRKYWLAQDIIRAIADSDITSVNFIDGSINKIETDWTDATNPDKKTIIVTNRDEADFMGIPQYGYYAVVKDGKDTVARSMIKRVDGRVVEQSMQYDIDEEGNDRIKSMYINSRRTIENAPLGIKPMAERVEYLGGSRFKLTVDWQADRPATKDLSVFVHFFKPQVSRLKLEGWYAGGGFPDTPTSEWSGTIRTGEDAVISIPNDIEAGEYDILVGLFDSRGDGQRYPLLGDNDGETRFRLGKIIVERTGGEVSGVKMVRSAYDNPLEADRLVANPDPVEFGPVTASGAMRIDVRPGQLLITPLPGESDGGYVTIDLRKLYGISDLDPVDSPQRVQKLDADQETIGDAPYEFKDEKLTIRFEGGVFAYTVDR